MTLHFLSESERGPKTAVFGDWNAIYSPAECASEILSRSEFDRSGVYVLRRDPKRVEFRDRIYIGKGSVLRDRLKTHISTYSKNPFTEFIAFSGSHSIAHVGTVSYMEHRLVSMASQAKSSEIDNKPLSKEPTISTSEKNEMESFLERMKVILPVFGFRFLEGGIAQARVDSKPPEFQRHGLIEPKSRFPAPVQELFKVVGNIAIAFMYRHEGRFVVTKGSQANKKESATIGNNWVRLRRELLIEKILIDKGSHYEFTEDTSFSSTSAASSVVLGRQTSGPISWIHLASNLKYAELLERGLL